MKDSLSRVLSLSTSQTAKDTYWVFGSNLINSFLAFLYTIFLVRIFIPSDFGIFSAVLAFTLLVSDIADLGMGSSLARFLPPFYAENKKREALSFIKTTFLFQVKIALLSFLMVLIFSLPLAENILKQKSLSPLFLLSSFGITGIIILAFVAATLSAQRKFREVAIISTLSTLTKLLLVVFLFLIHKLTLFSSIFAFMFSVFIAFLFSLRFFSFSFILEKEKKETLRKLLSYSSFLAFSRFFSAIGSRLDALMLIPLSSSFEAGIYGAAYKIISLYILLAGSFSTVIAPRLSGFQKLEEAIRYLRKVIYVVAGILGTMIAMYFIAPWFVTLVLGNTYSSSIPVFQALLIPMAFFTMTIPAVNFLLYTLKKPQVSTINTFVQLLVIFFGNLIFIPRFGRFGPVITLSIVYGFTFISASFFAVYFFKKTKHE